MLALCAGIRLSAQVVDLDSGIASSVAVLVAQLPPGKVVALTEIKAPSPDMTEYLLAKIQNEIMATRTITLVEEKITKAIMEEQKRQVLGLTNTITIKQLGEKLGADFILSVMFANADEGTFLIQVQAREVTTSRILVGLSQVARSDRIDNLIGNKTRLATALDVAGNVASTTVDLTWRIVFGASNIFFGVGSFLQGDVISGLIVGGLELSLFILAPMFGSIPIVNSILAISLFIPIIYGFAAPFLYHPSTP